MKSGKIADESITASFSTGPVPPHFARLNGLRAWRTGKAQRCYLQVRLVAVLQGPIHAGVHLRSYPVVEFCTQYAVRLQRQY